MIEFFKPGVYFDFMGKARLFAMVSLVLTVGSIASLATRGLNFGLDFAGGYEIQVKLEKPATEEEIKAVIAPLGIEGALVQRLGDQDGKEFLIMIGQQGTLDTTQQTALKADFTALAGGLDKLHTWSMAESGETMRAGFEDPITEEQVREVLTARTLRVRAVTVGERRDHPTYTIELYSMGGLVQEALGEKMGVSPSNISVEFVGPQVGAQLRNQGIMAVLMALGFLMLYIAVRFDFYFAPGAIVATLHDIIVVLGVFSVFQIHFSLAGVAGMLTLIGYSLNDTVVVYDRIRENLARLRGRELRHLVSSSISETLSRTILTSVCTMFVVIALIVWGGRSLLDFSMCLLVGTIVGTYSSIALASPTYVLLREHYDRRVKTKAAASAST